MKRSRLWRSLPLALVVSCLFASMRFQGCHFIDLIDSRAIDFRFIQRGIEQASDDVIIVAVDDRSIEKVGRWPWPRTVQAKLVDIVASGNPSVIGFDIVQSEETVPIDRGHVLQSLGSLGDGELALVDRVLASQREPDRVLATALEKSDRAILGYYLELEETEEASSGDTGVDTYSLLRHGGDGHVDDVPTAYRVVGNLEIFRDAARGQSYFNVMPDEADGVLRRVPMVLRFGEEFAQPLALSVVRAYLDHPPTILSSAAFGVDEVRLGDIVIPTAENGELMLNYRGPGQTFRHVPAVDLLNGTVDPKVLEGKVVLIGVTATAVVDIRVTPFDGVFPGVEVHATVIDNVLRQDFVWQPAWLVVLEMVAIVVGGLLLGGAMGGFRGWTGALGAAFVAFSYLALSQWAFDSRGYVLSVLYPTLSFAAVFGLVNIQNYLTEERERRRTRRMLELYLSPSMAEFVSERPERMNLGGDKRAMTVLFSDIRGFTRISEGMTPEQLVECLNVYLGEMTDAVFATSGMLDKYVGDAVMAVWGAPLPSEDHARQAVSAANDMVKRLARFNAEAPGRGFPTLEIGIGINTGEMVFGNMGSRHHMALTVMGDEVNLASRLEGLTSMYGAPLIVSESTLEELGEGFYARELDLVRVKGRVRPSRIFEVYDPEQMDAAYLDAYAAGLAAYKSRAWEPAQRCFGESLSLRPGDRASALFLSRCEQFAREDVGPDWDGVSDLMTK